ncbi:helix-turn-helix domain-containing protein [Listeria monocytogenes]|nr:helix-turn-helix domain-containing protein [Listeria monocytogenes]
MKRNDFEPLSCFNDEQRAAAAIYKIIEPNIIGEVPLPRISDETIIPLRTLQRWKNRYQKYGLSGLIRNPRSDSGSTKVDTTVQSLIENTRLNNRRISIATIHRKVSAPLIGRNLIQRQMLLLLISIFSFFNCLDAFFELISRDRDKILSSKRFVLRA